MDTMQLGGNIELNGFNELERSKLVVVKKIVGNYAKEFSDKTRFDKLSLTLALDGTEFKIAADYELMLRFLEKYKISTHYIPEVFIKMRIGGTSNKSMKNIFIKSCEDYKAWKINSLNGGISTILLKNLSKIPQFLRKY